MRIAVTGGYMRLAVLLAVIYSILFAAQPLRAQSSGDPTTGWSTSPVGALAGAKPTSDMLAGLPPMGWSWDPNSSMYCYSWSPICGAEPPPNPAQSPPDYNRPEDCTVCGDGIIRGKGWSVAIPNMPRITGPRQGMLPGDQELTTLGFSAIDDRSLSYHHAADDYLPGQAGVPIRRHHISRELAQHGSFGAGVFSNFDIRLVLLDDSRTDGWYFKADDFSLKLFDPSAIEPNTYFNRTSASSWYPYNSSRIKELELLDDQLSPVTENWSTNWFDAKYAIVHTVDRSTFKFEILKANSSSTSPRADQSGNYDPVDGRLIEVASADGHTYSIAYKSWTTTEIAASPSRQWQIDTVTDAAGRVTTFEYYTSQIGGRWCVSTITLPDASEINYSYAGGLLSQVTHVDNSVTTITYTAEGNGLVGMELIDPTAEPGHRRKKVYLTGTSATVGGTLVPTSMGLVRAIENNEGEFAFVSLPTENSGQALIYEGGGRLKVNNGGSEDEVAKRYYTSGWSFTGSYTLNGSTESVGSEFQFNGTGAIAQYQGTDGTVTEYMYDSQRRVIYAIYDDYTFESYCYSDDVAHEVTRYRNRNGDVTRWTYNSDGNKLTEEVGLHDSSTNSGESFDPYTGLPDYDRCATDDVQTDAYALIEWQYGTSGLLTAYIDGNGNETNYEYNLDGLLSKVIHPPDVVSGTRAEIEYTYDSLGRIKKTIDAYDEETEYFYDARGRRVSTLYADGTSDQVVYGSSGNGAGLVVKSIDRNKVVTTYEYDAAERLVTKTTAAAKIVSNSEVATPEIELEETWTYLHGTRLPIAHTVAGALSELVYDYRGRNIETHSHPRSTVELVQTKTYVGNQLFCSEDAYGRKTYFDYDATDGRLIRTVQGTVPSFSLADFAAVTSLVRDSAANATYIVTDTFYDAAGQLIESKDGRNVSTEFEYDSRGRQTAQIAASGVTGIEARTETSYDDASNVIEVRSPRYFDSGDSFGYQKAKETWTYTGRNLEATHTEAPGAVEEATESFAYDLNGRPIQHQDFAGNIWTTHYEDCCGHAIGQENPVGDGSIVRQDATGKTVHEVTVEDLTGHFTAIDDPIDAKTYRETTTRFDGRGRPTASTVWLVARGSVDTSAAPIAGLNSVSAADGLTTQYLYDDNLTDASGLDSSSGSTYTKTAASGTSSVSLAGALIKLADTQANGGAGISFGTNAPGSAVVTIDGQDEIEFTIQDAMGRTVMSGKLDNYTGIANDLLTWSSRLHDTVTTVTGYGDCLETKSIDALGKATKMLADAAGRTLRSIDQLGNVTAYTYDAAGNQLSVRDPNNVGQDVVYDALGRAGLTTDTTSATTNSTYDKEGNRIAAIDGKSNSTVYAFDARGRQKSQTDRLSGVTNFTYLATGQLASLTDAESQTTSYTYDDAGQKLTETYPDHTGGTPGQPTYGIVTFTNDPAGRVLRKQDQKGDTCTYIYDLAGRLTGRDYRMLANSPSGTIADSDTFTYDKASRMLTAASGRYANTVTYTYDSAGRKATEALTISGETYTTTTGYDAKGQLTSYTYPDGTIVGRIYTDRGELYQLTHAGTTIDTRVYDNGGRMTSSTYNNGVGETRSYNSDNTLASISFSGAAIGALSYSWDDNKNKTGETISGTMSGYGFSVGTSGYDNEDRLVNYNRTDGNLDQSWSLSEVGDWDSVTTEGTSQSRTHGPTHEFLSASGSSVSTDVKGNITLIPSAVRPNSQSLAMHWDFDNRLNTADVGNNSSIDVIYKFDALGRRVFRDDGTNAVVYVQAGQQTIADYPPGAVASSPTYRYVYSSYIDEPVLRYKPSSIESLYYHRNQQYSIVALSSASGVIVERYAYSGYGTSTITDGAGSSLSTSAYNNRYTYTGREWDAGLSMYHFRARMYDSVLGRFCSRDPIGYEDGVNLYRAYFCPGTVDPAGLKIPRGAVRVPCDAVATAMGTSLCAAEGGVAKPPTCYMTPLLHTTTIHVRAFCKNHGDCDWEDYTDLRAEKTAYCSARRSCARIQCPCKPESGWTWAPECNLMRSNKKNGDLCISARRAMMNKCFKGGDARHRRELQRVIDDRDACWKKMGDCGCREW